MRAMFNVTPIIFIVLSIASSNAWPVNQWYADVYGGVNYNGQLTLTDSANNSVQVNSNPTGANVNLTQSSAIQPPVVVQATASLPIRTVGSSCTNLTTGSSPTQTAGEGAAITADRTMLLTCQNGVWIGHKNEYADIIWTTNNYTVKSTDAGKIFQSGGGAGNTFTLPAFTGGLIGSRFTFVSQQGPSSYIVSSNNECIYFEATCLTSKEFHGSQSISVVRGSGWWQIDSGSTLASNCSVNYSDLNNLIEGGCYFIPLYALNTPESSYFKLEILRSNDEQDVVQRLTSITFMGSIGHVWQRIYSNNNHVGLVGWTPWVRVDRGFVGFSAYANVIDMIASWQRLTGFTNIEFDTNNGFNPSNSTYTAPYSGYYNFTIGGWSPISDNSNSNSRYGMSFYVNGVPRGIGGGGSYSLYDTPLATYTQLIYVAAGDTISVYAYSSIAGPWGRTVDANYIQYGIRFSGSFQGP